MARAAAEKAISESGLVRSVNKARTMCAASPKPRPGWLEDAAQDLISGVLGQLHVKVMAPRDEDTLREATSGNSRSGDSAAGPRHDRPPRREPDRLVR